MRFCRGFLRSAHNKCGISGAFQALFHLGRFIQCTVVSHPDTEVSVSFFDRCREILFQKFVQQAVCVSRIPERADLYTVDRRTGRGVAGGGTAGRGIIGIQRIQDPVGNCLGDILKVIVKQLIIRIGVDKSDFDQNGRHVRAPQDDQIRAGFDAEVDEPDRFQLFIDIFRHLQLDAGEIVYKRFYPGYDIIRRKRVAVDGDKEIDSGFICFRCFLERRFVNISSTRVFYINSVILQYFSKGKDEAQSVVAFPASVIDSAGVTSSVCRVLIAATVYAGK